MLVVNLVGWTAVAVALLIPITIGLVRRQQARRTLVRVGRARSWVARPGEGGYAPSQKASPAGYAEIEDEDRIVERLPRFPTNTADPVNSGSGFGSVPWEDPRISRLGFGDPSLDASGSESIFGGPTPGGAGFEDQRDGGPDQASLNSPSTTSSFPWSVEPPSDSV